MDYRIVTELDVVRRGTDCKIQRAAGPTNQNNEETLQWLTAILPIRPWRCPGYRCQNMTVGIVIFSFVLLNVCPFPISHSGEIGRVVCLVTSNFK